MMWEAAIRIGAPLIYAAAVPLLHHYRPAAIPAPAAVLPLVLLAAALMPPVTAPPAPSWVRVLAVRLAAVVFLALVLWGAAVAAPRDFAVLGMVIGVGNGVFGMLAAHDLIHARGRRERLLGRALLTAMTYRHFRISHMRGHHRHAGTAADPATARRGEGAYGFVLSSILRQVGDVWRMEARRGRANRLLHDAMIYAVIYGVAAYAGWARAAFFLIQSLVAIVVLELFNYVAHYGLVRPANAPLTAAHCWDAPGRVGNWLLLDMGRHADHHHVGNDGAPHLPGGYAGAVLLALCPPLWRRIMDPRAGAVVVAVAIMMLSACAAPQIAPLAAPTDPLPQDSEAVKRGAYLVAAGNCLSCHTDKKRFGRPFAGGGEVATPFGVYYSRNITPDRTHGIGAWSDQAFLRALRRGIAPNGEYYFPAFPFTSFTGMADRDILDIKAYLMTQASDPAANRKPAVSFPFNVRAGMGLWRSLYFHQGPLEPDPAKSEAWNRGNYLVNAVAHCAECHTRRNRLGALDNSRRFAGGKMETPGGKSVPNFATRVPNITSDLADGIGRWSIADIVKFLRIGQRPNADFIAAPMSEVIEGTSKLTDADLQAIAVYLKSLPALPGRGG